MKEVVKEKEKIQNIFLSEERKQKKLQYLTPIAFLVFAFFVLWMYFVNQEKWKSTVILKNQEIAQLQGDISRLQNQNKIDQEAQFKTIKSMRFDAFDADFFRMYGLYRDAQKKLSVNQVAERFNIYNPRAIEMREVMGERWFIVPVKGNHFFKNNESIDQVAALYYEDAANGKKLIQSFNKQIQKGKFLFIPF